MTSQPPEFSLAELGLIETATRKTAVRFWGEAKAAEELNPPNDVITLTIIRAFTENAEKMKKIYTKVNDARKRLKLPDVIFSQEELATIDTSLREPIIRTLGESQYYLQKKLNVGEEREFYETMSVYERQCAEQFINLRHKINMTC